MAWKVFHNEQQLPLLLQRNKRKSGVNYLQLFILCLIIYVSWYMYHFFPSGNSNFISGKVENEVTPLEAELSTNDNSQNFEQVKVKVEEETEGASPHSDEVENSTKEESLVEGLEEASAEDEIEETETLSPIANIANEHATMLVIPKVVHITSKDKNGYMLQVKKREIEALNPGYVVELYDDTDMLTMVNETMPQYLSIFNGFSSPVERADFWRYAVLYVRGGIYLDSDVDVLQGFESWGKSFSAHSVEGVVGIEMVCPTEEKCLRERFTSRVQFCQWTFASRPNHTLFKMVLESIAKHVDDEAKGIITSNGDKYMDLLYRTGPGQFTKVVQKYLEMNKLKSDNVVDGHVVAGGIGFLGKNSFGHRFGIDPNPADMGEVYIRHNFAGSWK